MGDIQSTAEWVYADKAYDLVYQSGIGEFGKAVRDAVIDTAGMLAADDDVELDEPTLFLAATRLVIGG